MLDLKVIRVEYRVLMLSEGACSAYSTLINFESRLSLVFVSFTDILGLLCDPSVTFVKTDKN